MNILLIIIGGGIGALFRHYSTQIINNIFINKFILGTIFVNCIGSFLMGFFMNIFSTISIDIKWKLFIITGFLGGYTTFSAYSFETTNYIMNGNIKYAILNIVISNIICLLFVFFGIWINKLIILK